MPFTQRILNLDRTRIPCTWRAFALAALFVVSSVSASAEGTLRVALMAAPPTKGNPHAENIDYLNVWSALFDPLTLVSDKGELLPWLATSWEQESDTSWVFRLRDDVTYSNGVPFDASAVITAVNYLTSDVGQIDAVAGLFAKLETAEAIDSHTVRFVTSEPFPLLPYALQAMRLPEPNAWRDLGRVGFGEAPIGTGPFVVEDWGTTRVTLAARPDSWRPPNVNAIQFDAVRDPIARLTGLFTDQFDVIMSVDTDSFGEIEAAGAKVRRNRTPAAMALMFNTVGDPRLQNVDLRRAMNYAVNKQLIIDVFFNGATEPATQPAPRMAVGFNADLAPYPYDPDRARRLLEQAGYGDGFSFVAEVNVDSALSQRVIQQVASDLSQVGISMTLQPIPRPLYLKHFQDGDWGGSAFPAGYFTPTMDALETMRGGSCLRPNTWYCDESIVPDIEAAMAEPSLDRRTKMVRDLMTYAHDTAHGLFLYESATFTGLQARVENYETHGSFVLYERVRLDP